VREAFVAEEFAPITSSAGFVRSDIDVVARYIRDWQSSLGYDVRATRLADPFPDVLHALEPLTTGVYPRELLITVGSEWVAYFSCSLIGTDGSTRARYLARKLMCSGVAIRLQAYHDSHGSSRGNWGGVHFELFGPRDTEFVNDIRAIALGRDHSAWSFTEAGEVQPFEEVAAYRARRRADRFTAEMLQRYCEALELHAFDVDAYRPQAVLLAWQNPPELPKEAKEMSLADAQSWLGIREAPAPEAQVERPLLRRWRRRGG
jgi:hypothetical protein